MSPEEIAQLLVIKERAQRLVDHADFRLGGALSASSRAKDIPSKACSQVKARHLASLRDALQTPCAKCGSVGFHACPGAPVTWTEEAKQELTQALQKLADREQKVREESQNL